MALTYTNKAASTRSNGNPKTFSITCAAGTDLLVLTLVVDGATERTGGAPTFNSVAMTQAGTTQKAASSPETSVELWYMLAPPTGSAYTVSIPNSGTLYITAEAAWFSADAGNKVVLHQADGATGTSTNPTGPTHTSLIPGDVLVAVVGSGSDTWTTSLTRNGTSLYDTDEGAYGGSAQYLITPDNLNAALTWTRNSNEDWAIASAAFREEIDSDTVMAVSKESAYAVLSPPQGSVSKVVGYAVLSTEIDVSVSKVIGYAVLEEYTGKGWKVVGVADPAKVGGVTTPAKGAGV